MHVLVFGHSFIRRLDDAFNSGMHPQIFQNFGLRNRQIHCAWVKNCTIFDFEQFKQKARLAIPNFPFKAAILQIGGNDITESSCPLELACKLEDLSGWLKNEYNIPVIFICDIFTRPIPRDVSPVTYESKRCDTMQYLNNLIDVCPEIRIWKHRWMFNCPNNIFLSDGVHLNYTGMKKFYESLKLAVILATELD